MCVFILLLMKLKTIIIKYERGARNPLLQVLWVTMMSKKDIFLSSECLESVIED